MNEVVDINGTPYHYESDDTIPLALNFTVARRKGDIDSSSIFQVLASGDGELFNPQVYNGNIPLKDKFRGGNYFKLMKCSQKCHQAYVTFLRSKNRTHFVLAQRRLLDGYN